MVSILRESLVYFQEIVAQSGESRNAIAAASTSGSSYQTEAGNSRVYVWGLNDKDQLGGMKGSKVKLPVYSETLSNLCPVHIAGGSKTLFVVSADGKVRIRSANSVCSYLCYELLMNRCAQLFACGEGSNGRLGLGHSNNVSSPTQLTSLNQYVIKKVAVHSGGKHAMALTVDGKVQFTVELAFPTSRDQTLFNLLLNYQEQLVGKVKCPVSRFTVAPLWCHQV